MKKFIYASIFVVLFLNVLPITSLVSALEFANTYPYGNQDSRPDELDPWGWYKWNCTSYAGWKVREKYINNFINGFTYNGIYKVYGNGGNWDNAAIAQQFSVSDTPSPGAIAVWDPYSNYANHQYGHVAYVERVNGNNSIDVSHYNTDWTGSYGEKNFSLNSPEKPSKYIIFGSSCSNIANITIKSGSIFTCSGATITVSPETVFEAGSNVNLN